MIFINKIKKILYIGTIALIIMICPTTFSYAAYPKLISTLLDAFETIQNWLLVLATPAAAISVATGLFMKKFSFGDDEKIRAGKKLIRTALFSYAFIILLNLILTTISNLLS